MGYIKDILDDIANINTYTSTSVTAFKVNVEWAREALKKMEQLADEIEEAYQSENSNIQRCWYCCVEGLGGEIQGTMEEAVGECRLEYISAGRGVRQLVEAHTRYLDALVEADKDLAEAIRNA